MTSRVCCLQLKEPFCPPRSPFLLPCIRKTIRNFSHPCARVILGLRTLSNLNDVGTSLHSLVSSRLADLNQRESPLSKPAVVAWAANPPDYSLVARRQTRIWLQIKGDKIKMNRDYSPLVAGTMNDSLRRLDW